MKQFLLPAQVFETQLPSLMGGSSKSGENIWPEVVDVGFFD